MSEPTRPPDIVMVQGIRLDIIIGEDCWGEQQPQPVIVTASVHHSIQPAAESDSIEDALDYRAIHNTLLYTMSQRYMGYRHFLSAVANNLANSTGCSEGEIKVEFPKAILHVDGGMVISAPFAVHSGQRSSSQAREHIFGLILDQREEPVLELVGEKVELALQGIRVSCIVGIGEKERVTKQPLVVNLFFQPQMIPTPTELHQMVQQLIDMLEASQFFTVEKLASQSARLVLEQLRQIKQVKITVIKPSIFSTSEGPGVSIVRTAEDFGIH